MILKMMENRGGWEVTERTADDVKMMSKHRHVLQILQEADGAWVTAKEMHEHVDGSLDAVKKMLLRMAKKGEIQSSGSGGAGYRVAREGDPNPAWVDRLREIALSAGAEWMSRTVLTSTLQVPISKGGMGLPLREAQATVAAFIGQYKLAVDGDQITLFKNL
jgi:hypothetical protein